MMEMHLFDFCWVKVGVKPRERRNGLGLLINVHHPYITTFDHCTSSNVYISWKFPLVYVDMFPFLIFKQATVSNDLVHRCIQFPDDLHAGVWACLTLKSRNAVPNSSSRINESVDIIEGPWRPSERNRHLQKTKLFEHYSNRFFEFPKTWMSEEYRVFYWKRPKCYSKIQRCQDIAITDDIYIYDVCMLCIYIYKYVYTFLWLTVSSHKNRITRSWLKVWVTTSTSSTIIIGTHIGLKEELQGGQNQIRNPQIRITTDMDCIIDSYNLVAESIMDLLFI